MPRSEHDPRDGYPGCTLSGLLIAGLPLLTLLLPNVPSALTPWLSGWACLILSLLAMASLSVVWQDCALPCLGDFSPRLGGPGMRTISYHPQLQALVEQHPGLNWMSWRMGILLRVLVFLGSLVGLFVTYMSYIAPSVDTWTGCMGLWLVVLMACTITLYLPNACIDIIGRVWSALEPPTETPRTHGPSIGIQPPSGESPLKARVMRVLPLTGVAWLCIGMPYLLIPNRILGAQLACLGVALLALIGYPLQARANHLARRYDPTDP